MKKTGLIVFAILCSTILIAQTSLKKAINSYEQEQYYACIKTLEPLVEPKKYSDETKAEINFYIGLSYLRLSNPAQAISYFNKSISLNNNIHEAFLYLGESMQMMEHYEEAEKFYSYFLELKPKDSICLLKYESLNYCKKMLRNPSAYKVRIMPSFNTVEMDYSPFFDGKDFRSVYFTSSRFYENKTKTNKESGEPYSNIYVSTISKDGFWSFPKKIEGHVNTDYDEGTASINRNSKNLYFTRCTYNKNKDKACRIYMARKSSNFWTKAELVAIRGLPEHISVGHPCISPDELSLYFVADSMLGGYGGKDIYKITRTKRSDTWGGMQNLGPDVNTRGDESYPYIRYDGTLYFASNGHLGMGGYDIFKAEQKGTASYTIENMGFPINSSHDDFGIVFMDDLEEGYLTSERKGGMGKADIYYFVSPQQKIDVSGIIRNKRTNETMQGVTITLLDDSNFLINETTSNEKGEYMIKLEKNKEYVLYVSYKNYQFERYNINTNNLIEDMHFTRDFFLVN